MTQTATSTMGRWQRLPRPRQTGAVTVVLGLLVVWGIFQVLNPNYLSARNLSNLLLQIAVLGTLAVGMVVVLVVGEIDLSVGAIAGVSAASLAIMITDHGVPAGMAIVGAILLGGVIGLIHGTLITSTGVPSFIITLAGLLVWQGVQLALVGDGGQIPIRNAFIRAIASTYAVPGVGWALAALTVAAFAGSRALRRARRSERGLEVAPLSSDVAATAGVTVFALAVTWLLNSYFGIPWGFVLLFLLVIGVGAMMSHTLLGRHIYAIGGNREAARRSGIRVKTTIVGVFVLISMIAAAAGIIEASRQFSASNALGGGTLQLNAIAAAVIGGTSLFGGRGRAYHALLGALVVGSVANGLDLLGQPAAVKNIATGVILVIAVVLDALGRRRRLARGAVD